MILLGEWRNYLAAYASGLRSNSQSKQQVTGRPMNNITIRFRVLGTVVANVALVALLVAITMNNLTKLRGDLKEIAETDIVMVGLLARITEHQLEQALG